MNKYKALHQCCANSTKKILAVITYAMTFHCLMVSLWASASGHPPFLAAFQAQLWPLEKGPLPPLC